MVYNVFSDFKILKNISPYHPKTDPTGNGLKSAKMIKIDILTTLKKNTIIGCRFTDSFSPITKNRKRIVVKFLLSLQA